MPVTFSSGAQLIEGSVVQATAPGSDVPPSHPAPEEPVVDSPVSASDASTDPGTAETDGVPAEDGASPEDEPEAEEQLVLPPTNRGQRRFVSNLIRENERAKAELDALRQQQAVLIQRLQAPVPPQSQAPASPPPQAITREAYPDEASYVAALVDFELSKRSALQTAQQRMAVWDQRVAAGNEHYADFQAVINNPLANPSPTLQPVLYEAVCESEQGAALLYTIGKDLTLLRKLNAMTPTAAAREIGRLEEQLTAKPAAPRPTTAAPPPPIRQPVSGGGAPAPVGGFRPGMSVQDYEAMRRAQRARR